MVGIGKDEFFIASDATPIVEYTKEVVYVKDEEIAVIKRGEPLKLLTLENQEVKIDVTELELSDGEGGLRSFYAQGDL